MINVAGLLKNLEAGSKQKAWALFINVLQIRIHIYNNIYKGDTVVQTLQSHHKDYSSMNPSISKCKYLLLLELYCALWLWIGLAPILKEESTKITMTVPLKKGFILRSNIAKILSTSIAWEPSLSSLPTLERFYQETKFSILKSTQLRISKQS